MKKLLCSMTGLALAAVGLFSTSCANSDNGSYDVPGQTKYSSMPQNLPQSWEGQGMLGGMAGYQ